MTVSNLTAKLSGWHIKYNGIGSSNNMGRIYTNNGQNISTKVTNKVDRIKYIVSTAQDPRGPWQLAVFRVVFEIPFIYGKVDYSNPYIGPISKTFKEAEMIHGKVENIVNTHPPQTWLTTMHSW